MADTGTLILLQGHHSTFVKGVSPKQVRARLASHDDDGLVDLHGDGSKILSTKSVVALVEAPQGGRLQP